MQYKLCNKFILLNEIRRFSISLSSFRIIKQMDYNKLVSLKIKEARKDLGYSAEHVAKELDVCKATYSNWENGKAEITVAKLESLSRVLQKPIAYFINTGSHVVQVNNAEQGMNNNYETYNNYQENPELIKLINQGITALTEAVKQLQN